jgi:carbon-monoxide dehydrogenase medium subunit
MILPDFEYHRPTTVREACELLAELGPAARVMAGGTDLLVDLKRGVGSAAHVVALRGIAELTTIEKDPDGTLRLGPMVTPNETGESPIVRGSHLPISEAALTMAAHQIRNRATVGGNLASAVPSADMPPVLIAMGTRLVLASKDGRREVPLEGFFTGPRETVLRSGEIIAQIVVPPPAPRSGACYQKHSLRNASALAVVGVAAWLRMEGETCGEARIVLGAVAPTPLLAKRASLALSGERPDSARIAEVAKIASEEAKPISDLRGSAQYRRSLTRALAERAVGAALERAGANGDTVVIPH